MPDAARPMRVLHVIPGLSPADGGPTAALHAMAAATARNGALVTVVASDDGAATPARGIVGTPVLEGDVEYRFFARSLPGSWKLSLPMARWLAREIRAFDVVHVHAAFSFATIPGVRFAHRARVPIVYRPLGTLAPWSLKHHGWKKRPYYALIERGNLQRSSAIHVTAASEADDIAALGFADRVHLIPLGVDFPPPTLRHPRRPGPIRLLFLSRLHAKKGIPVLLDAVAMVRARGIDLELSIAGDGSSEYRAELEQRVRRLGLAGSTRFVGHVAGTAKQALLDDADVFVLPSFQENFGIAVAEALASGLPVVVSDQVGLAPDVRSAGAGIVTPIDPTRVADAIAQMASDDTLRSRMGTAARSLSRERFSWQRTAEQLIELYSTLIERGAA